MIESANRGDKNAAARGRSAQNTRERFRDELQSTTKEQRIAADRTRLAYSQSYAAWIAELLATAGLALLMLNFAPRGVCIGWSIAAVVMLLTHGAVTISFWHAKPDTVRMTPWAAAYLGISIGSGVVLGTSVLIAAHYFPVDSQFPVIAILAGAAVVAYVTKAPMLSAALGAVLPLLAPVQYWLLSRLELYHQVISGVIMVAVLLLVIVALRSRGHMGRLSLITMQNRDLTQHLTEARKQAEHAKDKALQLNAALKLEIRERELAEQKIRQSEHELSSILNNLRDMIFRADRDGIIQWVSPSVYELLQYHAKDVIGQPIAKIFEGSASAQAFMTALDESFGSLRLYMDRLVRQDGERIWGSINAHYYHDAQGEIIGIEGTLRDITAYHEAQQALLAEKGRAQVTLAAIADGVITTDVDGKIDYLNGSAEAMTGRMLEQARGMELEHALLLVDQTTREPIQDHIVQRCMHEGRAVRLTEPTLLISGDGSSEFSIELSAALIRDAEQNVTGVALALHDVTELREMAHKLWYQATHDALTGLINRREFEYQLSDMLAEAEQEQKRHCVCYLDLDQFKVVNDTCGHAAGDDLLRAVSEEIKNRVREIDTVARLGGDEFGVLLRDCPIEKAQEIAESIRDAVEKFRFVWKQKAFRVGASIGVVPITMDRCDLTQVLTAADSAMYVAKESGRNRVHIFAPDDTAINARHGQMDWKQRIHDALDQSAFRLYFQPIVSLSGKDSKFSSGEVLVRMIGADGSITLPGAFLPAAERYHLMPMIDRWVVTQVLSDLDERRLRNKPPIACSINLSGQSLSDESFYDFVREQLEGKDVDVSLICFEITETAVIANLSSAKEVIGALRGLGCKFALDDFGSGMSSFAYLKTLPVDYLKIDGNFIQRLTQDPKDRAVVKAINEISHVMGMQTVAEMVEDEHVLKTLRSLKIDFAQGYAIARPAPFEIAADRAIA